MSLEQRLAGRRAVVRTAEWSPPHPDGKSRARRHAFRLAAPCCDLVVLAPFIARHLGHAAIICRGRPSGNGDVKRAMVWCQPAPSPSWQDSGMERVLGIGGYFMRAADAAALGAWYRDYLGLDADENGLWRQGDGPTVFATFDPESEYFGSRAQQTMLNFRVGDLDAMLAQLRDKGADVASETQDMEGVGRFGWVTDPEGNRVELWQPG
jgi:predicted enzyme related to lactoylglutathione lyase